jgi:hypothetical protein
MPVVTRGTRRRTKRIEEQRHSLGGMPVDLLGLILWFTIKTKQDWQTSQLVNRLFHKCTWNERAMSLWMSQWTFAANRLPTSLNALVSRVSAKDDVTPQQLLASLDLRLTFFSLLRVDVPDEAADQLATMEHLQELTLLTLTLTDAMAGALAQLRLTALTMRECWGLRDETLEMIAANPNMKLKRFDLAVSPEITNRGVQAIMQANPTMEYFSLLRSDGFTGEELTYSLALQTVKLRYCDRLTDASLLALQKLNNLHTLLLEGNQQVSDVGPLAHLRALKTLSLEDCGAITKIDQSLLPPNLTGLDLTHTKACLIEGSRASCALLRLNLARRDFGDDCVLQFSQDQQSLRSLRLANDEHITDQGLRWLAKLVALQTLDLSGCCQITLSDPDVFSTLVGLRRLMLSGCNRIGDKGMSSLSKLVNLQSLYIVACHLITAAGVHRLSTLQNLRVCSEAATGCAQATLPRVVVHTQGPWHVDVYD